MIIQAHVNSVKWIAPDLSVGYLVSVATSFAIWESSADSVGTTWISESSYWTHFYAH